LEDWVAEVQHSCPGNSIGEEAPKTEFLQVKARLNGLMKNTKELIEEDGESSHNFIKSSLN